MPGSRQPPRRARARGVKRHWIVLAPTAVLALLMCGWVTHETRDGVSDLAIDSAVYLSTATSMRHFHAPTAAFSSEWDSLSPAQAVKLNGHIPTTHFPPGYAAALAATSFIAGSVRGAARLLGIVLIGINLGLIGWFTARITGFKSAVVATIPGVLLVTTSDIPPRNVDVWGFLTMHLTIASEPLFSAVFLVGVLAISRLVTNRSSTAALLVASGATAAAILVRYVGVTLLFVGLLAIVVFDTRDVATRLRKAAVFGALALAPIVAFVMWGAMQSGGASQSAGLHYSGSLKEPLDRFGWFLFPVGWSYAVRTVLLLVVTVGVVVIVIARPSVRARFWDRDNEGALVLAQLALITVGMYLLVLAASRAFIDRHIGFDSRLLSPVRGIWYAVVIAAAYRVLAGYVRRSRASAALGVLAAAVVVGGWSQPFAPIRQRFVAPDTRSTLDRALSRLPSDVLLFSSHPHLVYLHAHRSALAPPSRLVYSTGKANHDYDAQLAQLVDILEARGGYLDWRPGLVSFTTPAELRGFVTLRLVAHNPPGAPVHQLYEVSPGR